MNDHDRVLTEVAALPDPVLPAREAQRIQQLARTRLLEGSRATEPRQTPVHAGELVAAALLCACVLGYMTWTAVTVASLQTGPQGVLWERAGAISPR